MRFEQIIQSLLQEKENKREEHESLPWSIEIKKDPNGSKEYNEIGDIIIKLVEIRAKL